MNRVMTQLPESASMDILAYVIGYTDCETKIFQKTYTQMEQDLQVSRTAIADVLTRLKSTGLIEYLGGSRWKNNMIQGFTNKCDGLDYCFINLRG